MTFRQIAQLEPQDARVYLQIGDLLKQQNDLNGALAAYSTSLVDQTKLPVAQKAIREILADFTS
ncbi:MAG: hypothetical protein CLLPBCKN_008168 [Chroococcidiopsis cubana SAG 39.79]|uniref:hypothetical protein n=1 Tax=Chroococcidiopsis cubana TaxID=171392 RepID=UPI002AC619C1|nr:hypothetical protein [Chroococcidiopsis cubana]MDZ4878731.1 hypothetical protein [Chroococcidiopsis cubana SAG 39.79]